MCDTTVTANRTNISWATILWYFYVFYIFSPFTLHSAIALINLPQPQAAVDFGTVVPVFSFLDLIALGLVVVSFRSNFIRKNSFFIVYEVTSVLALLYAALNYGFYDGQFVVAGSIQCLQRSFYSCSCTFYWSQV